MGRFQVGTPTQYRLEKAGCFHNLQFTLSQFTIFDIDNNVSVTFYAGEMMNIDFHMGAHDSSSCSAI
jgi:hypothetical protein